MKFIRLTAPNGSGIWINPQRIASMTPSSEGYEDKTHVDMGGGGFRVQETIDEIIKLIADTEEVR